MQGLRLAAITDVEKTNLRRKICHKGKIVNYAFYVKLVNLYFSEETWWY